MLFVSVYSTALAETVIYKDKDGVYRSVEKEPEGQKKEKSLSAGVEQGGMGMADIQARIKKFCSDVVKLNSTLLLSFYYEDAGKIRKEIYKSKFSGQERDFVIEMLDNCTKLLNDRASALRNKERKTSAKESEQRRLDESFEKLVQYVEERLEERRRSGVTLAKERFATALDIHKMTYRLSYGISSKDVRDRWGRPLWIYGQKGSNWEAWKYPVGVVLYFSYDKLQRWDKYR